MRSTKFEDLASLCNWVILPSCAEGQPGSVLECMSYGLIPILSDDCNIDLDDWGIRIPGLDVDTISSIINIASKLNSDECRIKSDKVLDVVQRCYTPDNFRANFKTSVQSIMSPCKA
jgi:hypothetical protein